VRPPDGDVGEFSPLDPQARWNKQNSGRRLALPCHLVPG
jgi:hypothetical protein